MTHDELIRALTAERFGTPTPRPPKRQPIPTTELVALLRELDQTADEEVA